MMLFFPSFLLGSGGPPPSVMGDGVQKAADVLPLTWVTKSIREPWLGIGTPVLPLVLVAGLAIVAAVFAVRRSAL
jgi:ABC-2 type transport system permease protein